MGLLVYASSYQKTATTFLRFIPRFYSIVYDKQYEEMWKVYTILGVWLSLSFPKYPTKTRLFCLYLFDKSTFWKIFGREILIRTHSTTPLQIIFEFKLNSKVICKNITDPEDTYLFENSIF